VPPCLRAFFPPLAIHEVSERRHPPPLPRIVVLNPLPAGDVRHPRAALHRPQLQPRRRRPQREKLRERRRLRVPQLRLGHLSRLKDDARTVVPLPVGRLDPPLALILVKERRPRIRRQNREAAHRQVHPLREPHRRHAIPPRIRIKPEDERPPQTDLVALDLSDPGRVGIALHKLLARFRERLLPRTLEPQDQPLAPTLAHRPQQPVALADQDVTLRRPRHLQRLHPLAQLQRPRLVPRKIVVGEDEAPRPLHFDRRPHLLDDVVDRPLPKLPPEHRRRRAEVAVVRATPRRLDRIRHQVILRADDILPRRRDRGSLELRPVVHLSQATHARPAGIRRPIEVRDQVRQRALGIAATHCVAVLQRLVRQRARVDAAHDDRHVERPIIIRQCVRPIRLRGHRTDRDQINIAPRHMRRVQRAFVDEIDIPLPWHHRRADHQPRRRKQGLPRERQVPRQPRREPPDRRGHLPNDVRHRDIAQRRIRIDQPDLPPPPHLGCNHHSTIVTATHRPPQAPIAPGRRAATTRGVTVAPDSGHPADSRCSGHFSPQKRWAAGLPPVRKRITAPQARSGCAASHLRHRPLRAASRRGRY
jgi:hypothetical protein